MKSWFESTGNFTPAEIEQILKIFNEAERDYRVSDILKMKEDDEFTRLGFSPVQTAKLRVEFSKKIKNMLKGFLRGVGKDGGTAEEEELTQIGGDKKSKKRKKSKRKKKKSSKRKKKKKKSTKRKKKKYR